MDQCSKMGVLLCQLIYYQDSFDATEVDFYKKKIDFSVEA